MSRKWFVAMCLSNFSRLRIIIRCKKLDLNTANESCKSSLHHLLDPKLDWQIQESTATGGTHQ
eukprot:2316969-Amphidinium_carterae.1